MTQKGGAVNNPMVPRTCEVLCADVHPVQCKVALRASSNEALIDSVRAHGADRGERGRLDHSHAVVTSLGSGAEPKGPVRRTLLGQAQANPEYRWTTSVRGPPLPEPVFPAPTTARPISTSTAMM